MLNKEVRKLAPIERFLYWIRERHDIYKQRLAGKPPPWTDDEVLRTQFFTNPYRENDKVTVWFREKIRDPWKDKPEILFASVAFRWFTWIPTGEFLLKNGFFLNWDTRAAVKALTVRQGKGLQTFTGAFTISNGNSDKPKINHICETCLDPVWRDRQKLIDFAQYPGQTLCNMHAKLMEYPGLGGSGFMAAQVMCELRYTYFFPEVQTSDWWTWCSPGPGSVRGLNILLGRPWKAPKPQNFLKEMNKLRTIVSNELLDLPRMHTQDIQSCCCEFFKYERALGGGTSKRRYNGVSAK